MRDANTGIEWSVQPLMPEYAAPARALMQSEFAGTRYLARLEEQLDTALQFEDQEYMALLAFDGETLVALAMFGTVAGARQCVKLHALIGADRKAMTALIAGIAESCARAGERLIVCELPDDSPWDRCAAVLLDGEYREEGRIPDYVTDGIALRFLVRRR